MAIVGNAKASVTIKEYFLSEEHPELAEAVAEMMSLFKIKEGGRENIPGLPPQDSVLIKNMLYYGKNNVKVTTKIYYSFSEDKTLAGGEKPRFLKKESRMSFPDEDCGLLLAKRLTKLNLLVLIRRLTGANHCPWGILRGVRPGKIARRLLAEGLKKPEIISSIVENYGVEKEKAELLADISLYQNSLFQEFGGRDAKKKVGVYIGIPYCPSKCLYCSFPSFPLPERKEQLDVFFKALKSDLEAACRTIAKNNLIVQTVYIGGGTPTSLGGEWFGQLLFLVKKEFFGQETREFTVEAGRPDSMDDGKIEDMHRFGVTRTSINPQSMQEKTLTQIGRRHTVEDIINVFKKIRRAEIPIVNMDIIAGLPGETEEDMFDTMAQIKKLEPDNITVHTLAVKRASLLKNLLTERQPGESSTLFLPGEATVRNMMGIAAEFASKMEMKPYYLYRQKEMIGNLENIGYAKAGTECFYNVQIIEERQTVIGIGPAAATKAVDPQNRRLQSCYNPKDVSSYIKDLPHYLQKRDQLLSSLYAAEK